MYDIDEDFCAGDIVILAEPDAIGFRFDRSALAAVRYASSDKVEEHLLMLSPVFEDMFILNKDDDNRTAEVHFDEDANTLRAFLSFIASPKRTLDWEDTLAVVEFAKVYDCDTYISNILYAASLYDPGELRLMAFAVLCEFDHLPAACRLLRRAGNGEAGNAKGQSLRPNTKGWTPEDSERISAKWMWALSCGVMWAESILAKPDGWLDRTRDDYWIAVVGEFMSRLTMCKPSFCKG